MTEHNKPREWSAIIYEHRDVEDEILGELVRDPPLANETIRVREVRPGEITGTKEQLRRLLIIASFWSSERINEFVAGLGDVLPEGTDANG